MTYFRRRTLAWWEELGAAALGAAVGLGAYYVVRNLVRRRDLPRGEDRAGAGDAVADASREEDPGASPRSAGRPGAPEDAGRPEGHGTPAGGVDGPR